MELYKVINDLTCTLDFVVITGDIIWEKKILILRSQNKCPKLTGVCGGKNNNSTLFFFL